MWHFYSCGNVLWTLENLCTVKCTKQFCITFVLQPCYGDWYASFHSFKFNSLRVSSVLASIDTEPCLSHPLETTEASQVKRPRHEDGAQAHLVGAKNTACQWKTRTVSSFFLWSDDGMLRDEWAVAPHCPEYNFNVVHRYLLYTWENFEIKGDVKLYW